MILVDSCIWIDWLRGKNSPGVLALEEIHQRRSPEICLNSIIYFEVLRGISSNLERKRVQRNFDLLQRKDPLASGFDHLATLYQLALSKGVSVHKLGDWLILKTLLDHQLTLLTTDRDFFHLHKVTPFRMVEI